MAGPLDDAIADPKSYANEDTYHRVFAQLRREDPVHWTEPAGYRPFWTVSKHADIMEVERQNDLFLNEPRTVLSPIDIERKVAEAMGEGGMVFRTLVSMDNPDHRGYRNMTHAYFMPPNVRKLEAGVNALARQYVDRMVGMNGACDFVKDVGVWYPLRVIMQILGVPPEDEPLMLKLTQENFGPQDPDSEGDGTNLDTQQKLFAYFRNVLQDRRRNPTDDVASVVANATINGEPISEFEALSYYVIIAVAGHDTTSSTTTGGLLALLQNPDQMDKLRRQPELLGSAVDEMLRWVTPVKHFFRTATQDYVLNGKKIAKGDNLMMCYWSGNRDEDVFDDPFAFRIDRSPNRHLAFGYGAHLCLGQHLAKLEIKALFAEILARIEHIELAGEPAWTEASFVSGLKRMPIRYTLRQQAA
ncbi:cytochrome P450 [Zavarzinia sp. CC-PAN008]|uniref:cytochrome P450 n=1 Tax=Zavarzinia sp. CC-PAN008 TaxID=3243332 RepID=UPI003F745D83